MKRAHKKFCLFFMLSLFTVFLSIFLVSFAYRIQKTCYAKDYPKKLTVSARTINLPDIFGILEEERNFISFIVLSVGLVNYGCTDREGVNCPYSRL